jgi:hypothetical protein
MKKYLFIDTKGDCCGLLQFLTLNLNMNAITCTEPDRFYRDSNDLKTYKHPFQSYKPENYNFIAVDSELVEKCKTVQYVGGTLNREMSVIENTPENRKILGI